jgi:AAA15 family ATPase/GTPase
MIVNFSIQNFGSIKEKQTLSFEATKATDLEEHYIIEPIPGLRLLKLALIYGANAAGKTTVLRALDFLRALVLNPLEKKTDVLQYEPFLFDNDPHALNSLLAIEFVTNGVKYYYEIEFNKNAILKEDLVFYNPSHAKVFSRTTNLENQFTEITFGSKIKKDKAFKKALEANTLWNNCVLGGFLKTNINLPELKEASDWFAEYLKALIKPNANLRGYITAQIDESGIHKQQVVEILKQADFNISDILLKEDEAGIPDGFIEFLEKQANIPGDKIEEIKRKGTVSSISLEFEHTVNGIKYELPFDMESQGTKRYYGFAGLLAMLVSQSVAFPIDELESSLHPDLFNHFILSFLINAKNSQIIATTHNREILNNRDSFRDDAIWFVDKNENCATELYSLSDFDSKVIRDTSNVYNAYKVGKLGGVPNLGTYYIDADDEKK